MRDVVTNQFKMTNASFSGTDKDGNPFKINAISGHQEYGKPDIVFLEKPSGIITRKTSKGKRQTKYLPYLVNLITKKIS